MSASDVLADPRELVNPYELTPDEQVSYDEVVSSSHKLSAAVGIGAAFLVYRMYMAARVRAALDTAKPDSNVLLKSASVAFNAFVPRWVSMVVPYLVAGYLEGVDAADSGYIPGDILNKIATEYAVELGTHINQVSAKAVVEGFQAQVNRKVPPIMAAQRAANAYGVTASGMNTLVAVWSSEDPKKLTSQVMPRVIERRAQGLIEGNVVVRAKVIGDNEAWAARSQAKQLVWMFGVDKGLIPESAHRIWLTAEDERVCPQCGPMDKMEAPVGVKFKTPDGVEVWAPGLHPGCRCDVILDFNVTENIADQLTVLLEEESVSKAQGQDPYNRDKDGQFAHRESRAKTLPYKEPEVWVLPDPEPEPVKTGLTKTGLSSSGLSGKRLSAQTKLTPLTDSKLSTGLSTGLSTEGLTRTRISTGLSGPKLSSSALLSRIRLTDTPVDTDEGQWIPLDRPIATLTGQEALIGTSFMSDSTTVWHELYPEDSTPDKYERSLNAAIGEWWEGVENIMMDDYHEMDSSRHIYTDPDTDQRFEIDDEAYYQAVVETINNIPKHASDMVDIYGLGENSDAHMKVRAFDVATHYDLAHLIGNEAPIIIVANHGLPGVTESYPIPGSREGTWFNPGKWHVDKESTDDTLSHLNYYVFTVLPIDL